MPLPRDFRVHIGDQGTAPIHYSSCENLEARGHLTQPSGSGKSPRGAGIEDKTALRVAMRETGVTRKGVPRGGQLGEWGERVWLRTRTTPAPRQWCSPDVEPLSQMPLGTHAAFLPQPLKLMSPVRAEDSHPHLRSSSAPGPLLVTDYQELNETRSPLKAGGHSCVSTR